MRYVAKIHVLDVMDQIVVSGYVVDCDGQSDPDHEPFEFAWQGPGLGRSEPLEWLQDALKRLVPPMTTAAHESR